MTSEPLLCTFLNINSFGWPSSGDITWPDFLPDISAVCRCLWGVFSWIIITSGVSLVLFTLTCLLNSSSFSIHMYSANGFSSELNWFIRITSLLIVMLVLTLLSLGSFMSVSLQTAWITTDGPTTLQHTDREGEPRLTVEQRTVGVWGSWDGRCLTDNSSQLATVADCHFTVNTPE